MRATAAGKLESPPCHPCFSIRQSFSMRLNGKSGLVWSAETEVHYLFSGAEGGIFRKFANARTQRCLEN